MSSRAKLADYVTKKIDSSSRSKLSKEIASYLIDNGQTDELNSLMRDVATNIAESKGVVEVDVYSAHSLTPELKSQIQKMILASKKSARKVVVNQKIDPDVIGGVRLEFPHEMLDLTVRAKLTKLRTLI